MVLSLLGGRADRGSSPDGRDIAAADLYVGPLESSLRHDEIAVEAFFPALEADAGVAFDEVARRHGDYALCGVAAARPGLRRGRWSRRGPATSRCATCRRSST